MNISLEDYFKSSFEEKLFIKMPERENDHLTVATRLLEKRREMLEVDQSLNAQKEEFHMKMESLTQRREDLEKKEFQLRETLKKFDKFLKENDSKRGRAVKKAIEERSIKRLKQEEITKLREETEVNVKIRNRLSQKLARYEIFQMYLEAVTETSEDFAEVREIIDRYATLTCNLSELDDRNKDDFQMIETSRGDVSHQRKGNEESVIRNNIRLSELQKELDLLKSQYLKLDDEYTYIRLNLADKALTAGRIMMSSKNLYETVWKRNDRYVQNLRLAKKDKDTSNTAERFIRETEEELTEVSSFIVNLAQMKEIAEKLP